MHHNIEELMYEVDPYSLSTTDLTAAREIILKSLADPHIKDLPRRHSLFYVVCRLLRDRHDGVHVEDL